MEEKNRVTATGIALELENLERLRLRLILRLRSRLKSRLRLRKQTVKAELCPDLVAEVLARLPCKSLMRFKCVSKMWRSTISDPSFCAARRRTVSTSGLFITCLDNYDYFSSSSLSCFYATRGDGDSSSWLLHQLPIPYCEHYTEATEVVNGLDLFPMHDIRFFTGDTKVHLFPMLYGKYYTGATEVVNGLVCFYKGNLASVFNLSTREIMCLPFFSDAKPKPKILNYNYYFGYASSCNEYKLLKIYNLIGGRKWEFLTLGKDASWRRPSSRADAPPIDLKRERSSVYIDGALCCWHEKISKCVILLDYADENWQLVDLPPQIAKPHWCFLLPLRGRFAVASPIDPCFQLEFWVLEGGRRGGPSPFWTNHFIMDMVIGLPTFDCFIGNLPTGEVLLTFCRLFFPIYAFDPTNGRLEEFEIGKFPSVADMIHAYYYEEDMTPLRHRISNKLQIMSDVKFI